MQYIRLRDIPVFVRRWRDKNRTRVVLHLGAPKTGTSALQAALAVNRKEIAKGGLWYPKDPYEHLLQHGRILSGNGLEIAANLLPHMNDHHLFRGLRKWDVAAFRNDIKEAGQHYCEKVLYSSEYLSGARPDLAKATVDVMREAGASVSVIYVVRDVLGHALSTYNQHIRQERECPPVEEFVRAYTPPYLNHLTAWAEAVGQSNVTVMHYDSVKERFFSEFLQHLGVRNSAILAPTVNESKGNHPSFEISSETEARWLLDIEAINKVFGPNPGPLSI